MTVDYNLTCAPLIPTRNIRKERIIISIITYPMSKPLLLRRLRLNPPQNPIQPGISMNSRRFTRERRPLRMRPLGTDPLRRFSTHKRLLLLVRILLTAVTAVTAVALILWLRRDVSVVAPLTGCELKIWRGVCETSFAGCGCAAWVTTAAGAATVRGTHCPLA
ncbi:hypothetical protein FOCG_08826 [Fusarium oxysporum f. sp. radicis-lycopersici 26381]|nr:hypothetical protein FOCG_08826 [Fusarium oxysporum f. sp. radicis-lycopersici 26381]